MFPFSDYSDLPLVLQAVRKESAARPGGRLQHCPVRLATHLWFKLNKFPVPENATFSDTLGQAIRKTHNFYGWRAEHKTRGKCVGTLYRTTGFLGIPPSDRNGTQSKARNIHLEHTMPASVLLNSLRYRLGSLEGPADVLDFLLEYSVCTAFSHEEENAMKHGVVRGSKTDCVHSDGALNLDHPFPFVRYARLFDEIDGFQIINVVTGEPVDIFNFTFDDHNKNLAIASARSGLTNDPIFSSHAFPMAAWVHALN